MAIKGNVFHTIRHPDGTWQNPVGSVADQVQNYAALFVDVSCTDMGKALHLLAVTFDDRNAIHTIRNADGTWQNPAGDVGAAAGLTGPIKVVGCAGVNGELQVAMVQSSDGRLLHTIRNADGTWQNPAGDAGAAAGVSGPMRAVSCAAVNGELHLAMVFDDDGRLAHTIRHTDGTWQNPSDDLSHLFGLAGALVAVACAQVNGELHLVMVTQNDGRVLHTIRHADGTWQNPAGDVGLVAGVPDTIVGASCAGANGELHVVMVTQKDGRVLHTIRHADGSWQNPAGDTGLVDGGTGSIKAVGCAAVNGELHLVMASDFIV